MFKSDSNDYVRKNRLKINYKWYADTNHRRALLNKERLTAPYVITTINKLPRGWRNFAHMVHRDLYDSFEYLMMEKVFVDSDSNMRDGDEVDIAREWQSVLTCMDKRFSDLPPKLFGLIVSHL